MKIKKLFKRLKDYFTSKITKNNNDLYEIYSFVNSDSYQKPFTITFSDNSEYIFKPSNPPKCMIKSVYRSQLYNEFKYIILD